MPNTSTNKVRLHRVLAGKPEKVYRAFLDADAMARWLPPDGFTGKVHHLDAKVGGTFKMSFTNFTTGDAERAPDSRRRRNGSYGFPLAGSDHRTCPCSGCALVTVSLRPVSIGTELTIEQEGLPDVIPLESCYLGWQQSLMNLARLVEPEIPTWVTP
jgi:uncharacterized protein YndB with AHSA1/START domain